MAGSSFRFDLAPVLQLRDRAVELAQTQLARAVDARKAAEGTLREAKDALSASLSDTGSGRLTVHQLGGAAAHREVRARTLAEAIQALKRSQTAETNAQRQLGEALRQREALVTLRTEAADAHRVDALRSEAARLDDLATTRRPPAHLSASPSTR